MLASLSVICLAEIVPLPFAKQVVFNLHFQLHSYHVLGIAVNKGVIERYI